MPLLISNDCVGKLLAKATADPSNVDVHDKALLYYRLLEFDPEEAQRVVCGDPDNKTRITTFTEDTETEVKDQIFEEFNSMSVIYGQPSHKVSMSAFIDASLKRCCGC